MCGIIGQIGGTKESLTRGLDLLEHRGPDSRGVLAEGEIVFGQCRLAIIDIDDRSRQPMVSKSGDTTIIFNGEIYNYQELREGLEREGVTFRTQGDTEVLLEGYEKHGISFLEKLRGMWAFAIHDHRDGTIVLSRDRFGIKPLYYATESGNLCFASEIKSIKAMLTHVSSNTDFYYQFFNLGYFLPPHTYLKEVKKLRPSEIAVWDLKAKSMTSSFLAAIEPEMPAKKRSFEETVTYMDEVLKDSIQAHFVSDVPVGLLLSGGNDSSLLAAIAVAAGKKPLLYNLAIEGSIDATYAKKVAEHLQLPLESVELTKDMLRTQYNEMWDMIDEPTADLSMLPTSLIFKAIKGKAKVVLSGEGGDEWFGGYVRHSNLIRARQVMEKPVLPILFESSMSTFSFAIRYLNPFISRARNFFLNNVVDDVISSYLKETKIIDFPIATGSIRRDLCTLYNDKIATLRAPAGLFFDRYSYLPNDLMHKTDTASMASSIEARVPFLDKEVFYGIENIDPAYCLSQKYKDKYLLKKIMEKYLPLEIIYRPKTGFSFSFEQYGAESFKEDFAQALEFHRTHANDFGLQDEKILRMLRPENSHVLSRKYPRFAFALITNWRCFVTS